MLNYDANELEKYFEESILFAKSHYENFPVISFFIEKELRKYIAVIYRFARQADDLADEGDILEEKRIESLTKYEEEFLQSTKSNCKNGFWCTVRECINVRNLNPDYFLNLLKAFKQDVWKKDYENYDELLDYCQNSANPIGRLILELHNLKDDEPNNFSDKICTALQLTNFYQDISIDLQKGRTYLPQSEMRIFKVLNKNNEKLVYSENFKELMKFQIERVKKLFKEGRKLLKYLPFRLRYQILVTIKGGELVLSKIEDINYNVLDKRPTLSKLDFLKIFTKAIILRR